MDAFFKDLGDHVLAEWKHANFSLASFPAIASAALKRMPPSENVDLESFLHAFLLDDAQPFQTESGFGEPEVVAYDHPRFYIQLLFWMDGTTAIHQHEFSGAFHVLRGSSIHSQFDFLNVRPVTPYFRVGDLRMKKIDLLETGATVQIRSGPKCIHSLFHLDAPSVTVVIRTQNDPGTAPQFNYHPPHVALDPLLSDSLTMRRRQVLDVLEQTADPTYTDLVLEMIRELDFERGFYILQTARPYLQDLGDWDSALASFAAKHGRIADGIGATLEEASRRETIRGLRAHIAEPEHRFFLALLMNADSLPAVLAVVAKRFPEQPPEATVLRWAKELIEFPDDDVELLDARFRDHSPETILAVLEAMMKKNSRRARGIIQAEWDEIRAEFAASSLRVLVAPAS